MMKTIRAFRDLPMNVIAVCGAEYDQDERKRYGMQPRLTGKISKEIQAHWDVVGYLVTGIKMVEDLDFEEDAAAAKKVKRRLWLQPMGKFDAKNRLAGQDVTHIDEPTLKGLVGLITKKKPAEVSGEEETTTPRKRTRE